MPLALGSRRDKSVKQLLLGLLCALGVTATAPNSNAQPWERDVYSIDVFAVDSSGTNVLLSDPLAGGFNTPSLDFGDIDADGDLDLFVQDVNNELVFYENVGGANFEFRSSRYEDLSVFSWFAVFDINGDGYADMLADQPSNAIRYYENDGPSSPGTFTLLEDTLRDNVGSTISPDLASRPALFDFDCNNETDLFMGRQDGTITRYEIKSIDQQGLPVFSFVEDRFQNIQVIGGPGKTNRGSAHGANALAIGDLNSDNVPDLVWGDFFESSLVQFENIGTCPNFDLERTRDTLVADNAGPFVTGGLNTPVFADIDGDLDDDLFVGVLSNQAKDAFANLYFFENNGTGFDLVTSQLIDAVDVGKKSKPTFADLDADGDLDLLIGNDITTLGTTGSVVFLENIGTVANPSFSIRDSTYAGITHGFGLAPTLGDLDDDGDADLLVGSFSGLIAYYENVGSPTSADFQLQTLDYLGQDVGSASTPVLQDLDADADLDLVVGESSGSINYFQNTGSPAAPVFASDPVLFAGIDIGQRSTVGFLDLDNDDDVDMLVGSQRSGVTTYANVGSASSPSFEIADTLGIYFPREASPVGVDIDNDTDPDLFFGLDGGGLLLYRNHRIGTSVTGPDVPRFIDISAYPNPADDLLVLSVAGLPGLEVDVVVFDMLGREVQRTTNRFSNARAEFLVLVKNLPAGQYLVSLISEGSVSNPTTTFTKI